MGKTLPRCESHLLQRSAHTVRFIRGHQQMHMVGHQHISMNGAVVALGPCLQPA